MSKKFENPCATYNIPFNSTGSDIFSISCAHLFNFLHLNSNHGKSTECKPMMLKMHLELYDSAFMAEAEEETYMECNDFHKIAKQSIQQLEIQNKMLQDALKGTDDFVKKLMERMENNIFDKAPESSNNTAINDSSNALLNNCDNIEKQCVQQLKVKKKTLRGKDDFVKELIDRNERHAKNNVGNKTPDVENNVTQGSNSNQETYNENNLCDKQNDTENVPNTAEEQELLDLRANCVYVQNFLCTDSSLDTAFTNVRKLANEMKAQIPDNSIIHIEVIIQASVYLDYFVYFRDADIKNEFLKNRHKYVYDRYGGSLLRILDYSNWGIVDFETDYYAMCIETVLIDVLGIARKLGLKDIRKYIDHVDVSCERRRPTIYSVRFNNERVKNKFLYNLKHFPKTNSRITDRVTDQGGHSLHCVNEHNLTMTILGENIIGVAALKSLSLTTDNLKRICILNPKAVGTFCNEFYISLMVEFSSKHTKTEFLKKKLNLEEIQNETSYPCGDTKHSPIEISDIETDGNVVSIKYNKSWPNFSTAVSFIGMAKQLGLSLTRYQINRFITLSKFT